MKADSILIRADIGPSVGTGHVMRTTALATAWCKLGGTATLICTQHLPGSLRHRLQKKGIAIEIIAPETLVDDAILTRDLAEQTNTTWLVIDGYCFDDKYQEIVQQSLAKLLVIDDFGHASHQRADLLLNQNIYATPSKYPQRNPDSLLLGTQFVLMRDEFSNIDVSKKRIPKRAKRILVTMGGSDEGNFTSTCLTAIAELPNSKEISVDAIVGASNPHFESLQQLCRELPCSVRLHRNTDRMSALIGQCDLAITAGGSTCYELARCGVPAITLSTAENQVAVARSFHESGSMIWLGDANLVPVQMLTDELLKLAKDSSLRKQMATANASLVDGHGAQRVARRLFQEGLVFRTATASDSQQIWDWRNEATVRKAAFQNQEIPRDEHQTWYERALKDRLTDIWIVESRAGESAEPIGPVRFNFDAMGTEATISISIAPKFRGQGWGTAIIEAACRRAFLEDDIQQIVAWIKPDNSSSVAAFQKAGFADDKGTNPEHLSLHKVGDQPAMRMVLKREQVVTDTNRNTPDETLPRSKSA